MRAWHVDRPGSLEGLVLRQHEVPQPGPHQVLMRVAASALNFRDLGGVFGGMHGGIRAGMVPLSDGAGEVLATGSGVTRVKAGDRVVALYNQAWPYGLPPVNRGASVLGGGLDGMLRDYVVLSEEGVVRLPEHLGYEEGATLPCAGLTAWNAIYKQGQLKVADTVVLQGTGGVSVFALQYALAGGARVIATTSQDWKAEKLRAMGAHAVINYRTQPEWDQEVLALTNGQGADLIVEVGGAGTLHRSLKCNRPGGRISIIGMLGGQAPIESQQLVYRAVTLAAVHVGNRHDFEQMLRAIETHQLRPVVHKVFRFEDAPQAFRQLKSGDFFGKLVIRHGPD